MNKVVSVILIFVLLGYFYMPIHAMQLEDEFSEIDLEELSLTQIDHMVGDIIKKSKVPGVSIVLVNGDQTRFLSYGYADKDQKIETAAETLFELGSMSKAFTGLGILLLEDEGKISIDDPVSKYIPWLTVKYHGLHNGKMYDGEVELTISNLLYQTSGIPFHTIGDIPSGTSELALEETVKTLVGVELDFYPGDMHRYATVNYDILGYIIQLVSGQTYESFIYSRVIKPLGLEHTYLFQDEAQETGYLAKGYKINFYQAANYNAPRYRGNTPAGYVISNTKDMERWMRIQMGLLEVAEQYKRALARSHIGDTTVPSQGEYYYGAGWYVHIKGEEIQHGGSNPNYSSMMIMYPEDGLGICVLSNLNSNAAGYLASNIISVIQGKSLTKYTADMYKSLDVIFSTIAILAFVAGALFIVLLIIAFIEIQQKQRIGEKLKGAKVAGILLALPLMGAFGYCIYYLPNVLLQRLPWIAVNVWGSASIMIGCVLGFIAFILFMSYVLLTFNFPKGKEKNYFALVPLSLINGISSALIIFTINESFNRNLEYSNELLVYFIFSIAFFVYTIKLLQGRMIIITNEITYEKRMNMIDRIICSSYESIEQIGRDRIFSGLNNDCAALAQIPSMIVNLVSNILTLLFCLAFLFTKNIWAFVASLGIILLNGTLGFITSKIATRYWEQNRDIQDTYFNQMQDLVNGFKELVLNKARRFDFWLDMKKYSRLSTELNKVASIKFLSFTIYNILMYNVVFGIVVFVFPILILDIGTNQLRENLFIVFYMIGPFGAITAIIPQLTQIRINVKRINKLIEDLSKVSTGNVSIEQEQNASQQYPKDLTIELKDVVYSYLSANGDKDETEFTIGPINAEFKTGEIVFITGGNGSGKSTLGKLITGLYSPQEGNLHINGKKAQVNELNELFSSVFSDYNLFKKLYGIDYQRKKDMIMDSLAMMKIEDKVEIESSGIFKSINLSSGQRKRLAFIINYLEEKPMMILDEWTAEQDPEFRAYFYHELLPMLKQKGKGVVVITHDDRYFDKADRVIKLEHGRLTN